MIKDNVTLKLTGNYALELLDDQYFFLPVTSTGVKAERLFALNELGSRIVNLIDGKNTLSDIVEKIHLEYAAEKEVITNDVIDFIASLSQNGIVEYKN